MRPSVGRKSRDIGAEQPDLTRVRPHVAADLVEQRGLAGTIRADDQAAFARPHRERYVLGDGKAAERLRQIDDFKGMVGCELCHRDPLRRAVISLLTPGTMPVGITSTMNRNTRPSSMFQRSI